MTIVIETKLETKLRDVAQKLGQDTDSYVQTALLRQIMVDESRLDKEELDAEMKLAASDPLFLEDLAEIQQAFQHND